MDPKKWTTRVNSFQGKTPIGANQNQEMTPKRITEKEHVAKKPGVGGASGDMVAHDLVNGCQAPAWRDERSEPPEAPSPPGAPKDKVTFQCDHLTLVRIFLVSKNARFTHMTKFRPRGEK